MVQYRDDIHGNTHPLYGVSLEFDRNASAARRLRSSRGRCSGPCAVASWRPPGNGSVPLASRSRAQEPRAEKPPEVVALAKGAGTRKQPKGEAEATRDKTPWGCALARFGSGPQKGSNKLHGSGGVADAFPTNANVTAADTAKNTAICHLANMSVSYAVRRPHEAFVTENR